MQGRVFESGNLAERETKIDLLKYATKDSSQEEIPEVGYENIEHRVGRLKGKVLWKYWEKEKQVRKTQVEIEFSHRAGEYLNF